MKILNQITSVFNTKQKKLLEEFLFKKVGSGLIQWKEVFLQQFKKRLPNLADGLKLNKIPGESKIDINSVNEQLEDIEITLTSLAAEDEVINTTLHRHEMFRKDDVKVFFNISQNYMDMINNEIKDYRTNNVTVENGIIEMLPTTIMDFSIKTVDVTYFPDNLIDRSGNDPTPDNIIPGTDADYWLSQIVTQHKSQVGAVVTFGFNGYIKFNILQFSTAGKYPLRVSKVEIEEGNGIWVEKTFSLNYSGKYIQLIAMDGDIPTTHSTEYVRVTFVQDRADFLWEHTVTNEREVLEDMDTEKDKCITSLIYKDTFDLIEEKIVKNVYSYIFGLYYARILLKTYDGDNTGNFYSRKFTLDNGFEFVNIKTTEYKPSPFTIEYKLIQHDGSYANTGITTGNILPNTKVKLLDIFKDTRVFSGMNGNSISLQHAPIKNNFSCYLNGKSVRLVDEFDETNDYQVMIVGKFLYFNKALVSSDTLRVFYSYRTDYIIVKITLKTNTVYQSPNCPKVLDFNVELS